ncbi:MAG: DUF2785 domain-containing protein [Rhizobium sp.]|nr:DUF2785 domain-containing protein [Rhizobium sp.]
MRQTLRSTLLLALALPLAAHALPSPVDCEPEPAFRARAQAAKAAGFEVPDGEERQRLALALAGCLGHPDPALRDGLAYEALATWLRADALDPATRAALRDWLLAWLAPEAGDEAGFRAPFAALVLSEVARTDRVSPWMTVAEREALVVAAAGYVTRLRDYRGFVDGEGWRHGLAHGADLLMQLALNPALDRGQLDRLLAAVAAQLSPAGAPAHVHGEAERLVRPVLFALQRGLHDEAAWSAWLEESTSPAPMAAWSEAYASEAGLARRHNVRLFLLALYAGLSESGDEGLRARLPPVVAALRATQ